MLSNAVEDSDLDKLDPADYAAEWKWDGIRVQVVSERGVRRLYSRTGDDISPAFPDLVEAMNFDAVLDGELLVGRPPEWTGTFSDLQQRLNRKSVSPKMREQFPVFVRCYDVLQHGDDDTRALPLTERRERLQAFLATLDPARFDLSPEVPFADWEELDGLRKAPPHPVIEGVMIKQRQSPYLAGRPKGPWFKWKRDPHTVDAVLMYAQRGHGKRSSYYSDYTFGVWAGPLEDERAGAGRQGLFRLHRRGTAAARQICPRQHGRAVRAGALGARRARPRAGAGDRLRGAEPLAAPPLGRRHALSPHFAHPLGQAGIGSRPHRLSAGHAGDRLALGAYSPTDTLIS